MDRHDVSEEVTAEIVADLHQKDLKIQHKFNCKGLTYWFDDKRKTAFCLVEAPDKASIKEMHDHAHGEVPHRIIEVDDAVVESFLGRIEDPKKAKKTELNIINEPAFRTIMVVTLTDDFLNNTLDYKGHGKQKDHIKPIVETIEQFKGRVVKQKHNYLLISFESVTKAVLCGLQIQSLYNKAFAEKVGQNLKLQMGLGAGVPVGEKEGLFEDTVKTAERLCNFVAGNLVVSSDVRDLYESETLNVPIDRQNITVLNTNEELFLNELMDYTEIQWRNPSLRADDYCKHLGYSKSQLYRKITSITGKSPNNFLKEYRLANALKLLNKKCGSISEVAFDSGFNSAGYFSKCFLDKFGILPSDYIKSIHV
jgi:AraC-like DNA-binding protein